MISVGVSFVNFLVYIKAWFRAATAPPQLAKRQSARPFQARHQPQCLGSEQCFQA
jgi:hypothetical protein